MVMVILMQASKGGGLASSFGGMGGAGSMLGARGAASFLQRATIGLAVFYALLCMVISFMSSGSDAALESKTQQQILNEQQQQPTAPAATELPAADPVEGDGTVPATGDNASQESEEGPQPEDQKSQENN